MSLTPFSGWVSPSLRAVFIPALLVSLAFTGGAAETEWPQFRGPTGQGNSNARDVPVEWSATNNVAWSVETPGRGWSSPVLANGRIYLTSSVGEPGSDVTLHVLCLDAGTGAVVWDVEVFTPDAATAGTMHRKNSLASPTPVLSDERVYVHFGHMGTAALDLGGNVIWRQTELKYSPVHGTGGSPALVGGMLVLSCDGANDPFVVGLDAATGQIRWKTPRSSSAKKLFSFSTPLPIEVRGETQVVSPTSGFVGAYSPRDGRELWRVAYPEGYSVVPRPVFAHGLLFVSSAFDRPVLYAIQPDSVAAPSVTWSQRKGAPCTPSPIVLGDELYFVSDGGFASCVDARTGKLHWSERLGGDFSASPIAAEGRVYFQNELGVGFVVKAGTAFELLAKNDLGERTLASYAVADGALFIRSESRLWKIGKQAN